MASVSRFFERDHSIDPQYQSSLATLPEDLRFQVLGPSSNPLEMTCKLLWGDRHVRLQNNPSELSRFLSSCVCYYWPDEVDQSLRGFIETKTPIKLEIFADTKKTSVERVFKKFPCIDELAIVPESPKEQSLTERLKGVSVRSCCYGIYYSQLPSSLSGCTFRPTTLQIYPRELALSNIFNKSMFSPNLKKFILTKKVYEDNQNKYRALSWLEARAMKASELSFIFRNCPNLEELTLSNYDKECLEVEFPKGLKHLSLGSSETIGDGQLEKIFKQCSQLTSLDIMRSMKWFPQLPGSYLAVQSLMHLEKFTISKIPSDELLGILLQSPVQSIELQYFTETCVRWLIDAGDPLLLKIKEISIDVKKNDLVHEGYVELLQRKYPHLEIRKNVLIVSE